MLSRLNGLTLTWERDGLKFIDTVLSIKFSAKIKTIKQLNNKTIKQ